MANQSIGTRLHLLRIEVGWSIEECAYRLTLSSNRLVSPGDWQTWERAADSDDSMEVFQSYVDPICAIFAVAPGWLLGGDASDASGAQVLEMSKASERQKPGRKE